MWSTKETKSRVLVFLTNLLHNLEQRFPEEIQPVMISITITKRPKDFWSLHHYQSKNQNFSKKETFYIFK